MLTWLRNTDSQTATSNRDAGTENALLDNIDQPEDRMTVVDGIITLVSSNHDIWTVRLLHLPEMVGLNDLNASTPGENDRMIYYSWHIAGGPLVYRLRAKRTLYSGERLVLQTWKETGSSEQTLHVGFQIATVTH